MPSLDGLLAGPAGNWIAIAAMVAATLFCRAAGYLLMARVAITPRVERGLKALPGSIVVALVVPAAMRSGPAGMAAILAGLLAMALLRNEIVALVAGLGIAAAMRMAGF